jgi:hypothetical protein
MYRPEDIKLLSQVRSDVLANSDKYKEGEEYLRDNFSSEKLYAEDLAKWREESRDPIQQARWRSFAAFHVRHPETGAPSWLDDDTLDHYECIFYAKMSAPPNPQRYSPGWCACRAIQSLNLPQVGARHNKRDKAVLLLAVVLWDADASELHPIFNTFGPYGTTAIGAIESSSRWMATFFLHDKNYYESWMATICAARLSVGTEPATKGSATDESPTAANRLTPANAIAMIVATWKKHGREINNRRARHLLDKLNDPAIYVERRGKRNFREYPLAVISDYCRDLETALAESSASTTDPDHEEISKRAAAIRAEHMRNA